MTFSVKLPPSKEKLAALPTASATKQYGLILPKKNLKKKELSSGFNAFTTAAEKIDNAINKDNKKDARRQVGVEVSRSLQPSRVHKLRDQALAEDASVFEYDAVYDDMKSARKSDAEKRAVKREEEKKRPKYITTLLQQAKIREVENERIRERRLLNERKADDALYGDKEKLVSASYKRKLQEMQRWDVEDARLAAMEEREDVAKQGENAIAGFYAKLNKNIAMGGSTDNARSAYTAKEARLGTASREQSVRAENKHEVQRREPEPITMDNRDDEPVPKKTRGSGQIKEFTQDSLPSDVASQDKVIGANVDALPSHHETSKELKLCKQDAIAAARARFLARKVQRKNP